MRDLMVRKFRQSEKDSGDRKKQAEESYMADMETLPNDELQIMKDTHPSNIHINAEIGKRKRDGRWP